MGETAWAEVLGRYAERVHQLGGDDHHVASPLGVWLVVALTATAPEGPVAHEIEEALGVDPRAAADFAARLIEDPHPMVSSGAAVWHRPALATEQLAVWKAGLPVEIETGDIPTQAALDRWADQHTQGLIKKFPLLVTPDLLLLITTALATRVSWAVPFELVAGTALGTTSPWSSGLHQVLASPSDPRHGEFITDTERAGVVAVHIAQAHGGLMVVSVVASAGVAACDVLATAHTIATAEAVEHGSVTRRSLFDLPLGDNDLWDIREERTQTPAGRNEERCKAILPAWSVESKLNLDRPALGIPAAASALATALGLGGYQYQAQQAAVARYSRVGFEAAAVTALGVASSAGPVLQPGIRRVATLRFGHPFAAVAVTVDEHPNRFIRPTPWHGLPVFSAWIAEPVEAQSDGTS